MSTNYIVKQGDHLARIARTYGFADSNTIWNAPENQSLKQERKNPHVLYPGDNLFIPDKETKDESRPTDKRHTFQTDREKLLLRIKLTDLKNQPLKSHDCTLSFDTDTKDLTTKADGTIEREIADPKSTAQGQLLDKGGPETPPAIRTQRQFPLKIGDLDPVDKISGQIARLNNLGYNAGDPTSPPAAPASASAHDPSLSGASSPNASAPSSSDPSASDPNSTGIDPNATGSDPNATAGLTDAQAKAAAKKIAAAEQLESAIEEFQCDFMGNDDLATIQQVVDGICGPKTQAKLLEIHGC